MGKYKKILAVFLSLAMAAGTFGCAGKPGNTDAPQEGSGAQANAGESGSQGDQEKKAYIEQTLNLAENEGQEWTYSKDADASSTISTTGREASASAMIGVPMTHFGPGQWPAVTPGV